MAGDPFGKIGFAHGVVELPLHGSFVKVVPGIGTGAGVRAEFSGGKDILPDPLARGIGPFADQCLGHVDCASSDGEVLEVFFALVGQVLSESLLEGLGQRDDAVFAALGVVNGDGAVTEIEVLDPESQALHETQAGAIHELGSELPWINEVGENAAHFVASHNDGGAAAPGGGSDVFKGEVVDAEDLFGEEGHGVEGLLLSGNGDVAFQGEIVEVGGDGGGYGVARSLLKPH